MNDRRVGRNDADLNEVLRRGRFEDLAGLTIIAGLTLGAALAVVLQLGGPQNIILPFIGVLGLIAIVASVCLLYTSPSPRD